MKNSRFFISPLISVMLALIFIIIMIVYLGALKSSIIFSDTPGKTINRKHTITVILEKDYNKGDTLIICIDQNTYVKGIY